MASIFLFGIYLLYKALPKEVFMGIVNGYFSFTIVMSISGLLVEAAPFFSKEMKKVIFGFKIPSFLQEFL
jgi:hypothetical protein